MTVTSLFSLACENIRKNFQEHNNNISPICLEIIYDDFYKKYELNKELTPYIPIMKDFILNKKSTITIKENNIKLCFYLHTWCYQAGLLSKSMEDKNGKYTINLIKIPTLWNWEFTVRSAKQRSSAQHRVLALCAMEREEKQEQKKISCNVLAHEECSIL